MKKLLFIIALVAFLFLITTRMVLGYIKEQKLADIIPVQINTETMTIPEMIDYIAPKYGQDPALIKKITYCESHHNPQADHDGGYGKGVTGFHRKTFEDWKVRMGRPELRYESNFDQIVVMAWGFSQGEEYRNAWTTYVAYTHGGVYSFYSKLLKGYYTVVCK